MKQTLSELIYKLYLFIFSAFLKTCSLKSSLITHFARPRPEISLTKLRRELEFVSLAQFHRVIGVNHGVLMLYFATKFALTCYEILIAAARMR